MAPVTIVTTACVFVGLLLALLLWLGLFQDRSRGRKRCPKCWYNMTGAPSLVCPECGHDARHERRLHRTRRRRWALYGAAMMVLGLVYLWQVRFRVNVEKHWEEDPHPNQAPWKNESLSLAFRPTTYLTMALASAPADHVQALEQRIRVSGLWSWQLPGLVSSCRQVLAQPPTPKHQLLAVQLLGRVADRSEKAREILVGLRTDASQQIRMHALKGCSQHAGFLRDDQLVDLLEPAMRESWWFLEPPALDLLLTECVRRRHPDLIHEIERLATAPLPEPRFTGPGNVELMTALCRIHGQPDPLRILLNGPTTLECTTADLPTVKVRLVNLDAEQRSIVIQHGGDYRGGRLDRWRFDVRADEGQLVTYKTKYGFGGGIYSFGPLEFEKSVDAELDMDLYVQPLPPGRYRVVVQYHNAHTIAHSSDATGLIVSSSNPFELIVRQDPSGARSDAPADDGNLIVP